MPVKSSWMTLVDGTRVERLKIASDLNPYVQDSVTDRGAALSFAKTARCV